MKHELEQLIKEALLKLKSTNQLTIDIPENIQIERPKDISHGDYTSTIALVLAKSAKINPKNLAKLIVDTISQTPKIKKIKIEDPGFINFFVAENLEHKIITDILNEKKMFGRSNIGQNKKVMVEFVSSNPTGPLTVGHGRHAAYGASVSDLLELIGYDVHREYYVNDAGRQMDILAISVWLRYLELLGEKIKFPSAGYKGDYIKDTASNLIKKYSDKFKKASNEVFRDIPQDEIPEISEGNKEKHIDGLIKRAKELLKDDFEIIHQHSLNSILEDIKNDLSEFGVNFQKWFSEKSLMKSGAIEKSIEVLKAKDYIYEKDGALWFKSSQFGDKKDHVVKRKNGQYTYFAPDIAYHFNKLERGFEILVNIFGSDHHGYVPRLRAAIEALGLDQNSLHVQLIQFVTLYKDGKQIKMSTREGSFITLRQLREEIGNDAARFFYIMRKHDQHMNFDLDLAKSQSSENPLYYIQYAHARICSVFRQLKERNIDFEQSNGIEYLNKLTIEHEKALMVQLSRYSEIIINAAQNLEPHRVANYLRDLATDFHVYYNSEQFIVKDDYLRNSRLCLIEATRQVIANGLNLLGVLAPEIM